ncbi:glycoside hydrolase family 3 N-terminal domain-containing protein [Sphingomonas melonis]|uniref:beta-glucosidase n=1 Tax=Sphingomonas melonis TaxID=152682 RepID=A0A7Y9FLC4_9SPHN|nr:glycoside hydrolase family 3 N-terminal domain-containing protein [Sphingomonas melonis]NYD89157.1 beta-glucosidase [Sphingomonas melonis]
MSRRTLLKGVSASAISMCMSPAIAKRNYVASRRIEGLIAKMSIEQKAGQLSLFTDPVRFAGKPANPGLVSEPLDVLKRRIASGELTGLFNGLGVAVGRELQREALNAPHGIPLIFGMDVIHGLDTVFPIPLGEAASFDPELARRTAEAAALESSARGLHWTFAPMVDVARDQRWGRVAEGAGEDTWLGSRFAVARVRGFQGDDLRDPTRVLACPKHFAGYGAVQGGMDYNTAELTERTLREVHLPPFKAAFDAGALSTMSSFNDIDGVPSTGNRHLLTTILRDEWKYTGFVVSDWTADEEMILHGYAADEADAVVKAITAGCDISMQSNLYNKHLPRLVREGRVPLSVVDEAVRRVLRVKDALGLFDNPYRSLDPRREKSDVGRRETLALAREAARRSIVLLRNEGGLLPLAKTASIALIGPSISDKADLPGPWANAPDLKTHVTIEEGFRAALGPSGRLKVVAGSGYDEPLAGGIEAAVAAARASDVVVLVVGETSQMSGEAQSRAYIGIPAPQQALAEAVAATGKPILVLLRHGRALALEGAVRDAAGVMATWFLGSQTGPAIADVVFGDHEPQGRLPVSFPLMTGQEPFYYNRRTTGRPQLTDDASYKARYREVGNVPLYPFGHGLGYSKAVYGPTQVDPATLGSGRIRVSAKVTNGGGRRLHEVVQLYVHDKAASNTRPIRELRGVRHLDLAPGESAVVDFELLPDDLAFVHADLRRFAEGGSFDVWIAPSSEAGTAATFALARDTVPAAI